MTLDRRFAGVKKGMCILRENYFFSNKKWKYHADYINPSKMRWCNCIPVFIINGKLEYGKAPNIYSKRPLGNSKGTKYHRPRIYKNRLK